MQSRHAQFSGAFSAVSENASVAKMADGLSHGVNEVVVLPFREKLTLAHDHFCI